MSGSLSRSQSVSGPLCQPGELAALVARFSRAALIAFDSEGDGMFRYRARLCTLQLASADEVAIVDTLVAPLAPLAALLGEQGPEKVVHDASFDARLLAAHGIALGRVFDTSVAARFLGFSSTGLASLLQQLFQVSLPKELQLADWGERPIPEPALRYLVDDVRYLLPLRDELLTRVRQSEIEAEVREECAWLLAEARTDSAEPTPFARVKGGATRPPKERARLYELALVRDAIGQELDLPPTRLFANDLLLRLAELSAPSLEELTRRLSNKHREYAPRLQQALLRAEARDDAPVDELKSNARELISGAEVISRKRRRELLTSFRTREAAARAVDPQVVLPGHCVNDLVKLPRLSREALQQVRGFGACRIERYADRLERELGPRWS